MYNKIRRLSVLLIAIILLAVLTWPAQAQDGDGLSPEEQERVAFVSGAFDNLMALDSYTMSTEQVLTQDLSGAMTGGDEMTQEMTYNTVTQVAMADGAVAQFVSNTAMEMDMSAMMGGTDMPGMGSGAMAMIFNIESRYVEDNYYMKMAVEMPGLPPEQAQMFTSMFGGDQWMIVESDTMMESAEMGGFFAGQMSGLGAQDAFMVATLSNVLEIEELESETIDGQEMRVFRMVLGSLDMLPEGYAESLETEGVDVQELLRQVENMGYEQTVWIGVDDELPHRIEMTINYDLAALLEAADLGEEMDMMDVSMGMQQINSTVVFSDFNEPVEVVAPEDAVPMSEMENMLEGMFEGMGSGMDF